MQICNSLLNLSADLSASVKLLHPFFCNFLFNKVKSNVNQQYFTTDLQYAYIYRDRFCHSSLTYFDLSNNKNSIYHFLIKYFCY